SDVRDSLALVLDSSGNAEKRIALPAGPADRGNEAMSVSLGDQDQVAISGVQNAPGTHAGVFSDAVLLVRGPEPLLPTGRSEGSQPGSTAFTHEPGSSRANNCVRTFYAALLDPYPPGGRSQRARMSSKPRSGSRSSRTSESAWLESAPSPLVTITTRAPFAS